MNNNVSMIVGALLAIALLQAFPADSRAADKPNIVFILSDDQGYGDLSCYGSEVIATPNIDRLCKEGMKFESFYVHNRCSPTRAAFMTGCHAGRIGIGNVVYRWEGNGLHANEITVAELLKDSGYATGMVGKWHLGDWAPFHPVHHGFDSFFGFFHRDDENKALFKNLDVVEDVKSQTDGIYSPKLRQAGIDFIKTHRDEPFFLYYASPLPHTKWIPHPNFEDSSKQGTYGDVVQEIDWQVGGLLDTLDELGLTENTLVIFASDNGPQLNAEGHGSAGPLRDGKWSNFEGGIRVPCLMRWPSKIPASTINNEITGIIDMLPTFCGLSGAEVPTDRVIDGRNILPYMLGEKVESPIHDTFVVPGSSIRRGDWKLFVKNQKPGGNGTKGKQGRKSAKAGSLFNLKNDLGETTDVSAQHPEKVKELRGLMADFMKEFDANKRPIGWMEGYSEDRVLETKRAQRKSKAGKKAEEKPTAKSLPAATAEGNNKEKSKLKKRGLNPARWEKTIKAFEASDAKKMPPKGAVLWIGGSNARRWKDVDDHFPNHQVLNRGFGGGRLSDIVHFADRIVLPYEPKTILLNAGGNDLAGGSSPKEVCDSARALIAKMAEHLPDTHICFNGLPSARPGALAWHKLMAELARSEKNVEFIDLAPAFTDGEGNKRREFFVKDGIHFNEEGYAILGEVMKGKF